MISIKMFRNNFGQLSLTFFTLLLSFLFLTSCDKSGKLEPTSGEATVEIDLQGVEFQEEDGNSSTSSSAAGAKLATNAGAEAPQVQVIPYSKEYELVATLQPISNNTKNVDGKITSKDLQAATVVRDQIIARDVKYRVVVFETVSGRYVTQQQYAAQIDINKNMILDAGKQYTFISYSLGTTANIAAIPTTSTLSTFSAPFSGNEHFMISKNTLTPTFGNNRLSVKMKHQLSQVIVSVTSTVTSANVLQPIVAIAGYMNSHNNNVNINFNNFALTYTSPANPGKTIAFTTNNTASVTSTPTILASPNTTTAMFRFTTLTIGTNTRTNIDVPNLIIKPGVRYELKLAINTVDDGYVIGDFIWARANLFRGSSTDYHFVASPELEGHYFIPNTLNNVTAVSPSSPLPGLISTTDPCRKVPFYNAGAFILWRTPTTADLTALRSSPHVIGQYNNVWGMYFGTTVVPTISNRDKYLFLPIHGYIYYDAAQARSVKNTTQGSYWSVTNTDTANRLYFDANSNIITIENRGSREGHQIRCVRNRSGL